MGIRNTDRVKEQIGKLTVGTVAEIMFTIDTGKKPNELAKAFKTWQLDGIQGWTMMLELPIDALAESSSCGEESQGGLPVESTSTEPTQRF